MQWAGVVPKAPRKGAHRRKRERRPLLGIMLHKDGSRHEWLEDQPALDLIVTLDDATGAIYSAFLVEEEGTASTFRALNEVFSHHGLPMSLYTDRGSHYFRTTKAGEIDRGLPTQVGRALAQLGVEHIGAFSPQARGRSERAFQTLQDRQVKELKLAGITTIDAANAFLREIYLPDYNARFAVEPVGEGSAFTPIPGVDLDEIACRRSARSETTIACPTGRSSCKSPRARCGPISSRRGSRSTSTPAARMLSFMGQDASAATTTKERSRTATMKNAPLNSARRRAPVDGMDKPPACPPRPQENRKQKKPTYDGLPKPNNSIRYRQPAPAPCRKIRARWVEQPGNARRSPLLARYR